MISRVQRINLLPTLYKPFHKTFNKLYGKPNGLSGIKNWSIKTQLETACKTLKLGTVVGIEYFCRPKIKIWSILKLRRHWIFFPAHAMEHCSIAIACTWKVFLCRHLLCTWYGTLLHHIAWKKKNCVSSFFL